MNYKKNTSIIVIAFLFIFCILVVLFEHYTYNKAQSGIKEHAHVISEALWNFNPTGVSEYLSLVCKSQNYQHLIVTDTEGKIFQKAKGEKPVWIERLFISLKLIPSVHLVSNVIHDRKTIGQIEAIWNCDTKYLEISALFALILIYTIFHLNVRLLHSKHALEDRVAERTSELSSLNNSLQIEVAEHHLARKALGESEVRYRALFNSAGDAIFLMKGSAFFECNQKTLQMFECSRDDIIGSTVMDFSPPVQPDGRKSYEKAMEKINAVMDGKPQFFEWKHKKLDGTLCDCEMNLSMANLPAGTFVQAIAHDITDRKQAEYEKEKLKAQLQQTQKTQAIGTLAGGIAHDFNNILSGIFGYSELAKMHIDDPKKAKNNIDQIVKGAQKAADLVSQILTFSRKSEHEMHPLQIFIEVKEAVKLLRSSIPSTIEIKENIASKAVVLADLTQIHQVVMNLCTNAYHAMIEKGGVLSIGLNETKISDTNRIPGLDIVPGTYLKLEVSDTGSGMSPDTLDKIFEPYFTTKELGEGTGLGLAVVLGIVKEHNGYIKAYSKPGKGSDFHVYFPVLEDQIDSNKLKQEKNIMQGGTERIMVVDDEISILTTMQELLEDYGYTVMAFFNGEDALKEFKKDPYQFDLIITDMAMPKMTGEELSSRILNTRNDLPIILCTGYSENFTEEKALELGIREYVQKPVKSEKLLTLVRNVLDKRESSD